MSNYQSDGGPIIQQAIWNGGNLLSSPITLGTADAMSVSVVCNATAVISIDTSFNVVLGTAAIATSATAGFFWMVGCAGAATGTPAATNAGRVPMVFDTTNGRLYAYYNSAWKYAAVTT